MQLTKKDFLKTLVVFCGAPFAPKPALTVLPLLPEPPIWLKEWLTAVRIPILDSPIPTEQVFIRVILLNETVVFTYYGGSAFGERRTVHPLMLYRVQGYCGIYVSGFCECREKARTFELSRVKLHL